MGLIKDMKTSNKILTGVIAGGIIIGSFMFLTGAYTAGAIFLVGSAIGIGLIIRNNFKR